MTYGLHFVVQPFQSLARILVFAEHFGMSKLQLAETLNIFISLWDPTLLLQSQLMIQSSEGIFQLLVDSMNIDEEREKIYMILKKIICQLGDEKLLKFIHLETKGYFVSILQLHRLIILDFTEDVLLSAELSANHWDADHYAIKAVKCLISIDALKLFDKENHKAFINQEDLLISDQLDLLKHIDRKNPIKEMKKINSVNIFIINS